MKQIFWALSIVLFFTTASHLFSKNATPIQDLGAALEQAKNENKKVFVQFGRERCSNCQALKKMIQDNKGIKLSENEYVYVDLNCDDPAVKKDFYEHYGKDEKFGKTLPFIVITSSDGTALVKAGGYQTDIELKKLLKEASKHSDNAN